MPQLSCNADRKRLEFECGPGVRLLEPPLLREGELVLMGTK